MDDEPLSLKELFAKAESERLSLETATDTTSDSFASSLATAIKTHEAALKLASQVSLFSANETLEDVATPTLPYMLLGYHLAELLQRQPSTSPSSRNQILSRARAAYEAFLRQLDGYEMLTGTYAKLWERYADSPTEFSTISSSDATARRNAKIANFRAEKALKEKLATLRRNPQYVEHGGDEELVRELHLAHIAFAQHMAFQALESLNRELEVLRQAPSPLIPQTTSVEEDERHRRRAVAEAAGGGGGGGDGYSERLDQPLKRLNSMFGPSGPLLNKEGKPIQPFTIVGTRSELAKGVFRPGHNLPTMSIDEYLEEERRRGNIIEGGGEASFARPEPDEDNYEKADAETYKARQWDEFTEENPKGAGNTLNRG